MDFSWKDMEEHIIWPYVRADIYAKNYIINAVNVEYKFPVEYV